MVKRAGRSATSGELPRFPPPSLSGPFPVLQKNPALEEIKCEHAAPVPFMRCNSAPEFPPLAGLEEFDDPGLVPTTLQRVQQYIETAVDINSREDILRLVICMPSAGQLLVEEKYLIIDSMLFSLGDEESVLAFLQWCLEFASCEIDGIVPVTVERTVQCLSAQDFVLFIIMRWIKNWDGVDQLKQSGNEAKTCLIKILDFVDIETPSGSDLNMVGMWLGLPVEALRWTNRTIVDKSCGTSQTKWLRDRIIALIFTGLETGKHAEETTLLQQALDGEQPIIILPHEGLGRLRSRSHSFVKLNRARSHRRMSESQVPRPAVTRGLDYERVLVPPPRRTRPAPSDSFDSMVSACSSSATEHSDSDWVPCAADRQNAPEEGGPVIPETKPNTVHKNITSAGFEHKDLNMPMHEIGKLLDMDASHVAKQLTLYIYDEIYSKITLPELRTLEAGPSARGPNITRMIQIFEMVSSWVETEVLQLSSNSINACIKLLGFFVRLASECRKLRNFHLLFALVAGLNQPTLAWVWGIAHRKHLLAFHDLRRVVSPRNNYLVYRADLSKCNPHRPKIPFIGLMLKDMSVTTSSNEFNMRASFLNHWRNFGYACEFAGADKNRYGYEYQRDEDVYELFTAGLQLSSTDTATKNELSNNCKQRFQVRKRDRFLYFVRRKKGSFSNLAQLDGN
mmetsp:Transcript_17820/g.28852  ORF Transcript_17820/g.28852 Transcript_17820/m.28852 type:complete len:679 (-) Transcript_17820:155-2191(-)